MGNARVIVLKNNFKEADNQPDYRVFVTKNEQENNGGERGGRGNEEI